MSLFNQAYSRRQTTESNITFGGLGGEIITPYQLVEDTSLNVNDILTWRDDGQDLHLHINTDFNLIGFGGTRGTPSDTQDLIRTNLNSIIDESGLIKRISGDTLFGQTEPLVCILNGLNEVASEGMWLAQKVVEFIAPNLKLIGTSGLARLGLGNGGIALNGEFPLLEDISTNGLDSANFKFTQDMPLMTGEFSLFRCNKVVQFPFENATGVASQAMRDCVNLEGDIILNNVVGTIGGVLTFSRCKKVSRIIIPNCTKINNSSNTFSNCDVLEELDIRKVTEWGDPTINGGLNGSNNSNLTIHVNTSLQTINSGSMHASLERAKSNGANIIWY